LRVLGDFEKKFLCLYVLDVVQLLKVIMHKSIKIVMVKKQRKSCARINFISSPCFE